MPTSPLDAWEGLVSFIETGGDVLWGLFAVTILMWTLIFERLYYFVRIHPRKVREAAAAWAARTDRSSWYARQIRQLWISRVDIDLKQFLPMIKSLVTVCPFLGLLGTVMGMLEVFDVMAISGNSNIRAMAGGVSRATVSTMAGMVSALSGLYFALRLHKRAAQKIEKLEELMPIA